MRKQMRDEMIEKLSVLEKKFSQIKATAQTAMFITCVVLLQNIKKKYRQELPETRISYYEEIFDGILTALQKRERMNRENLGEVCDLCIELLGFVKKELLKEKITGKKKEILFLPYKASMWDSLESIWRAAAADKEHCEAYVVPIPYCERNPDGSAAQWHCEADLFPEDVPVIDYREYDLKERRPDVIYIHNPYDGNNIVTSVSSEYYSYELKKYTDMLVYVPYFVVGSRWPEFQTALACYPYMDKMVVQHDQMQIAPEKNSQLMETDIRYLSDYIPPEKLVPLGSPKIDRVFYCEQHKKIPKEWEPRLQGKKVILYNISISGLLQFGEKALKKMKYVFDCFTGRNDVVLLWRPHPLLESTMKSMRTGLYDEYKRLEREFLDNKIGILDKTPDINMAVAIADAYLGEATSSVVNLFGVMAKPIFFTDDMMLWKKANKDELLSIFMGARGFLVNESILMKGQISVRNPMLDLMDIKKDELWFIAEGYNALCRMNLLNGKIDILCQIEDESNKEWLYTIFICVKNKLYFSPSSASQIYIYDLAKRNVEKISIEKPFEYGNFSAVITYKKYIFFFPNRKTSILRYNYETKECHYYEDWLDELREFRDGRHEEIFGWGTMKGNKYLIPALQTNKIMEFNLDTGHAVFIDILGDDGDCSVILEDEDEENVYWLFPWKSNTIKKWNRTTKSFMLYNNYPKNYICLEDWGDGNQYHFSGIAQWNGKIWLLPNYGNMMLKLDKITGEFEEVKLKLPYDIYERKSSYYLKQSSFESIGLYKNNKWIFVSNYDKRLIILDLDTEDIIMYPLRFTEEQIEKIKLPLRKTFRKMGRDIPFASNEYRLTRSIDDFIKYVINNEHPKEEQCRAYGEIITNADGCCGKKVHQYIMEQMTNERS